jgi:hypothetical protein
MRIFARTTPKMPSHRLDRWQEQKDHDLRAREVTALLRRMKTAGQELPVRPCFTKYPDVIAYIQGPGFDPPGWVLSSPPHT